MSIAFNRRPLPPLQSSRFATWVRGPTLTRDIVIVLIIKFALLMTLKYAFFNDPQARHMSLPPAQVAQVLLSTPEPNPSQGDQHAR
ncbi:cytochrome oxidase putative small subunit CydP [Paraburkholderia hayleyella]|uniref:cytochrome oxidase putative small subunit CydP n=1 Tax=Paraburkholderia hayleyella TaxID=2152889 RepID=UPI00129266B9|nr:cytochrome oxidase putative small subunit CydP [Paraburkholderia hayleyella]